jgi:sensor histidine kinase YesM
LEEELAVLARYVDVERVRLGARLAFELDVDALCRAADVPLFLLQPLVENAVRCAVAERSEGGRVRVRARAVDTELVLDVDDDGPGFPAKVLAGEGWGIGLTNVAGRLRTLFEGAARIELGASDLGGARVRLVLPRDDEGGAAQ